MNKKIKVKVNQGIVIGQECFTPFGTIYQSFKGIPYSVPPVGKLRFKSPVPLDHFDVPELDCTHERDVCHQQDPITQQVVGSENCLFLNIYSPKPKNQTTTRLLPVMVFIHGGGFSFGSGNSDTLHPLRFMEEEVIVVTINYRLGALGFLCLPEEGIWGNAGLKDQRLTLQWVQDNIAYFNGDPMNVTLFGESAGAACVHLHTYAEHANKLFHKAIVQSGTANMEWVFQINPVYKAHRMAELLGYKSSKDKSVLEFLQSDKVAPINLLSKTLKVLTPDEKRRGLPLAFKPVIEDSSAPDIFISRPIIDFMKTPNAIHMPIIIGYNSGEGMIMTNNAMRKLDKIENDLERFVPRNLLHSFNHNNDIKELAKKIREFYFNGQRIDSESLNALTDFLSDYHFVIGAQNAAEWQVNFQPTAPLYFYRFDYVGCRNLYKFIFQFQHLRGACHADELCYLFNMPIYDDIFKQMANGNESSQKDMDELCSKRLCSLWGNFARSGHPTRNSKNSIIDFDWHPVRRPEKLSDHFELDYLAIGNCCEMRKNPDYERINFWKNIYKSYTPTDYSRMSAKL